MKPTTHKKTKETWRAMHRRCNDPKNHKYPRYGGRGIKIYPPWYTYENFVLDMGVRPDNTTIDRIDNDGDYTPQNCRWATHEEQVNNRPRTQYPQHIVDGISDTIGAHARRYGLDPDYVKNRMKNNRWTLEQTLKTPAHQTKKYTVRGLTDTIAGHARRYKLDPNTVYARLHLGWTVEDAVTHEKIKGRKASK